MPRYCAAGLLFFSVIFSWGDLFAYPRCVAVLLYHEVYRPKKKKRKYNVAPKKFAAQMAHLKQRGFETIDLDKLFAFVQGKKPPLPEKPIVLHFDDGWDDLYKAALPILEENKYIAANFVVTGQLNRRWFQSWKMVKALDARGFQAASHTIFHPRLTKVSKKRLKRELKLSRRKLEKKLGRPVMDFALPYGNYNKRVLRAVKKAGYRTAYSSARGCNRSGKDKFRIKRYTLTRKTKFKKLLRKIEKKMRPKRS